VRGADRAELDDGLAQLARDILAQGRIVAQREPPTQVAQDLLGEVLLAAERLLVALARADHLEVELARSADVRPADRVVVARLDPVADLAAAGHLDLGDVPRQLALDPAARRHRRGARTSDRPGRGTVA